MANIKKIEGKTGTAYKITVTTGRDMDGKQIRHFKTWRPAPGMTERQTEKALQRALLQWRKPEMRRLVVEALHRCGREDLIGYGPHCLIRPIHGGPARGKQAEEKQKGRGGRTASARKEAPGSGRGGKGGRTAKGAANGKGQGPGRTQKGKGPQSGAARSGKFSARTARPGKSARPAPKAPRSGKGTKPSAPKRRSR